MRQAKEAYAVRFLHRKLENIINKIMETASAQLHNLTWLKGDWCFPSKSKETDELLRQCLHLPPPLEESEDIESEIITKSNQFPIKFPVDNVRLHQLKKLRPNANFKKNISSTYPLIHERVLLLLANFIMYKREFGSTIEKALYKDMSILHLVDRMLLKRSVVFVGAKDTYKLLTGEEGQDGWESVGGIHQKPPLLLDQCLSYDEMRLSAMLFVSGHTEFINNGERYNEAKFQQDDVQTEGVIIGLIGARLERKFRMEYEEMLITENQNTLENGYGEEITPRTCVDLLKTTYVRNNQSAKFMWRQLWSEFYQVPSYTYDELRHLAGQPSNRCGYTDRFVVRPNSTDLIDNEVFYKRLSVPFDCALLEANARAKEEGNMAFLNIVGIGLGVWKVSPHQTDVFLLTFRERLKTHLAKNMLNSVSDVNFAFINPSEEIADMFQKHTLIEGRKHPNGGVRVHLSNREPSSRLTEEHEGKLLVATYAWDGNAHPGNEFWMGSLSGSGDPAAACSTQVAELHNAHVNTRHVCARNLRIAGQHGLLPLSEYCKLLLGDK